MLKRTPACRILHGITVGLVSARCVHQAKRADKFSFAVLASILRSKTRARGRKKEEERGAEHRAKEPRDKLRRLAALVIEHCRQLREVIWKRASENTYASAVSKLISNKRLFFTLYSYCLSLGQN